MSAPPADVVISLSGIGASYGRTIALKDVTLQVGQGEVVGVLGANGAGKSTLLKLIAGQMTPTSGTLSVNGSDRRVRNTWTRVNDGVVLCAEGHKIVGSLRVEENLALGAFRFWPMTARQVFLESRDAVFEMFPVLAQRSRQMAATLSGGEQQMLAIGRSLIAQPKILLLDEPSLGLAPQIIEQIYVALNALKGTTTIVVVEQNSEATKGFCDRTYVLRLGEVVMQAGPAGVSDDDLRVGYFGDSNGGSP